MPDDPHDADVILSAAIKSAEGIHKAASEGDAESLVKFLDSGDADLQDAQGFRPVHMAARNGHLDAVTLLLDRKAAPDENDNSAWITPLEAAYLQPSAMIHGALSARLWEAIDDQAGDGVAAGDEGVEGEGVEVEGVEDGMDAVIGTHVYHVARNSAVEVDVAEDKEWKALKAELEHSSPPHAKKPGKSPKKEIDEPAKKEKAPTKGLDERRKQVARECFQNLDEDNSGALSKSEFFVIMAQLNPDITEEQCDKSFKKAKVRGDEIDLEGFLRWVYKMFGKADDPTFDASLSLLGNIVVDLSEQFIAEIEDLPELRGDIARQAEEVFNMTAEAGGDATTIRKEDLVRAHEGNTDRQTYRASDPHLISQASLRESQLLRLPTLG